MPTDLKTILDGTASAIAADPGLGVARFDADCELVGVHEVDIQVNGQLIKADQPSAFGGKDAGPKPTEFALAALGSCQAMTYRIWSERLGIRFDEIKVEVEGALDVQGILGLRDGVRPGFGDVSVNVRISGPEPRERYEELRRTVNGHCPVLDVFTTPVPVTTTMSVS